MSVDFVLSDFPSWMVYFSINLSLTDKSELFIKTIKSSISKFNNHFKQRNKLLLFPELVEKI